MARFRQRSRGRTGVRESRLVLFRAIRQIPSFVKLLIGLFRDRKVSVMDKVLVAGALAYVAMPADLISDFIPFLGLVDDVFLVATTLRRLIRNAGFRRALRYWDGDPADLRRLRIEAIVTAALLFLPRKVARRLRKGG